jgi:hypothetical protein
MTFGHFGPFIECLTRINNRIKEEIFLHYKWDASHNDNLKNIYDKLLVLFDTSPKYIFTTNYDRAIEQYCELRDLTLCDGFQQGKHSIKWNNYFESRHSKDSITLLKLHGSLNWKESNGVIEKTGGIETISGNEDISDVFIKPTLNKSKISESNKSFKIFDEIQDKFVEFLQELDVLIVIGFSYRDEGLVKLIEKNFLDDGKSIVSISPTAKKDIETNLLNAIPLTESRDFVYVTEKGSLIAAIPRKLDSDSVDDTIMEIKAALGQVIIHSREQKRI